MNRTPILLLTTALLIAAGAAQAGSLRFTIEAPGVQRSQVSGHPTTEETFDSYTDTGLSNGLGQFGTNPSPLGQYAGTYAAINDQDEFGGADQPSTDTFFPTTQSSYTLDFTTNFTGGTFPGPVGYFGFWWSGGDGNNELVVNMVDNTSVTFSTQSIIDSPNLQTTGGPTGDGHFGNPTADFLGQLDTEAFAFVNIYARNADSKITDIEFRQVQGSGGFFETDNHTISTELIDADNQTGADVPLPATALLLGAGLGLLGWTRRRRA